MSNDEKFIETKKITTDLFRTFGDLLKLKNMPDMMINQGMCARHHDLAKLEFEKAALIRDQIEELKKLSKN